MAQDFERHIARATGIVVDCFVTVSSSDYYLIKGVSIPAASSLELIDGGSRFVLENADALKVDTDTASSLDTWVSVISDIS